MGYMVETRQLGFTAPSSSGALGFTAPAAAATAGIPVVGPLIAAGVSLFPLIFGFNRANNARKSHDTAVLEAAQVAFHEIWYALTGEKLDGIEHIAEPGQYGAQHTALFNPSRYPDVPAGAAGYSQVDLAAAVMALDRTYQEAAAQMQRSQSVENLNGNYQRMRELFGRVQSARSTAPAGQGPGSSAAGAPGLPVWAIPASIAAVIVLALATAGSRQPRTVAA